MVVVFVRGGLKPPLSPVAAEFRITDHRLRTDGYVDGCPACDTGEKGRLHSPICKARTLQCFLDDNTDRQPFRERRTLQHKSKALIVPMDGFGTTGADHDLAVLSQPEAELILGEGTAGRLRRCI